MRSSLPLWAVSMNYNLSTTTFLEVNVGHGGSDFFQAGYYGGLSFLIYGR